MTGIRGILLNVAYSLDHWKHNFGGKRKPLHIKPLQPQATLNGFWVGAHFIAQYWSYTVMIIQATYHLFTFGISAVNFKIQLPVSLDLFLYH